MKVENTEARVHHIGDDITLLPSDPLRGFRYNEVADALWENAKKIPLVQHYLDTGVFREAGPKARPTVEQAQGAFESLSEDEKQALLEKLMPKRPSAGEPPKSDDAPPPNGEAAGNPQTQVSENGETTKKKTK